MTRVDIGESAPDTLWQCIAKDVGYAVTNTDISIPHPEGTNHEIPERDLSEPISTERQKAVYGTVNIQSHVSKQTKAL